MMKAIKRITTSLFANFDWAITQIENHEALVNVAMRDIQRAGAKAKVQLARVRKDGERLKAKLQSLRESDELWAERALRCSESDKAKALECLKQRRKAQVEAADLELQLKAHERLELDLAKDLENIYKRIEELRRKRNGLRSRESTAQAISVLQSQDMGMIEELDDVFDRWEIKVSEYESADSLLPSSTQTLEQEFQSAEEEFDLSNELESLLLSRSTSSYVKPKE